jgi:hypothetical protein
LSSVGDISATIRWMSVAVTCRRKLRDKPAIVTHAARA